MRPACVCSHRLVRAQGIRVGLSRWGTVLPAYRLCDLEIFTAWVSEHYPLVLSTIRTSCQSAPQSA
eukprot:1537591-Prymnesium_polylepis.1